MRSGSFEASFAGGGSHVSRGATPLGTGTISPLMRSPSFDRGHGAAPPGMQRTGSFKQQGATDLSPPMQRQRSQSFMMSEMQAQKVMEKFGDDESDLTEQEIENLWDQVNLDLAVGKPLEEQTTNLAAQWMKKSTGGQSHFVEHLGCSATVSALLQRNNEMQRGAHDDPEVYDKESGINVNKYRFTSSIIGGADLLPPAAVKSKYVSELLSQATPAPELKSSTSTTSIKAPKVKSKAARKAEMSKTDGLMLKQLKQAGINGAASLSRMPVTKNHFTLAPKEDLEELAARSIGVTLRKTQAQLNRKIDKLKVSLSEANLITFPPIQNKNNM
jgi:hypothetical protein